jgi:hypothetical protein
MQELVSAEAQRRPDVIRDDAERHGGVRHAVPGRRAAAGWN